MFFVDGKELAFILLMGEAENILAKIIGNNAIRWVAAASVALGLGIEAGQLVLNRFTGAVAIVQGSSMVPNFEPGARVYISPMDGTPKRGEVVLVRDGSGGCAIKRVIGLPRETVVLNRGYIYINGKMLREPYLPVYTFTHPDPNRNKMAFALGSGCYFILGDNRLYSHDSRHYGPVVLGQIVNLVEQGTTPRPEFAAIELPVHGRQARHRVEAR